MLRAYGASATMTRKIMSGFVRRGLINTPTGVASVRFAYDPQGILLSVSLMNAKVVKSTMSETQKENEVSAESATVRYLFDLNANVEFLQKKCSKCKIITPQSWFKVGVNDIEGQTDPMELLKLYKRVVLCQNCGNITVTN